MASRRSGAWWALCAVVLAGCSAASEQRRTEMADSGMAEPAPLAAGTSARPQPRPESTPREPGASEGVESQEPRAEVYVDDPRSSAIGPRLVDLSALGAPPARPTGPARPVWLVRIEGENLLPLEDEDERALRAGYGSGADGLITTSWGRGRPQVSLGELADRGRELGARTLAVVRLDGVGRGRRASLVLVETATGRIVGQRADLEPSLQVAGHALRGMIE